MPEAESSAAARLQTVNKALNIRKYVHVLLIFIHDIDNDHWVFREMDDEDEYLYGDTDAAENSQLVGDDPLAQLTPQQK